MKKKYMDKKEERQKAILSSLKSSSSQPEAPSIPSHAGDLSINEMPIEEEVLIEEQEVEVPMI